MGLVFSHWIRNNVYTTTIGTVTVSNVSKSSKITASRSLVQDSHVVTCAKFTYIIYTVSQNIQAINRAASTSLTERHSLRICVANLLDDGHSSVTDVCGMSVHRRSTNAPSLQVSNVLCRCHSLRHTCLLKIKRVFHVLEKI